MVTKKCNSEPECMHYVEAQAAYADIYEPKRLNIILQLYKYQKTVHTELNGFYYLHFHY